MTNKTKSVNWNKYFMSHYHPVADTWSHEDVKKYRQWYFSWLRYIESRCIVLQQRARIFELGSGVGAMATLLHDKGHEVVGSDISSLMVKTAKELNTPVPFVLCDVEKKLPVSKKLDVIMAFEVLEHLPRLDRAMKNIFQALRKGGYFVGTSPYPYKKNFLDPTHVNVKYPQEWSKIFRKQGFSDVKVYPMSFIPYLWRINKQFNIVLPFHIGLPYFVSTTLIIAKK